MKLACTFHIPWMDYPGDAYPGHPMEVDFPSQHKRFLDTVGDGSSLCYAALVDIPWSDLQLAVANYYCRLLVALSFDGLYTCCSADDCAINHIWYKFIIIYCTKYQYKN